MKDFGNRCAYSLQHSLTVGETAIHIDHFDPRQKKNLKQNYLNLFPGISHCNGRKLDFWPQKEHRKAGVRLLNPRKEVDYNHQIVECIETGELIGLNPAAEFHILRLGLNAEFLRTERLSRTNQRRLLNEGHIRVTSSDWSYALQMMKSYRNEVERKIPVIKAATPEQIATAVKKGIINGPIAKKTPQP
jgi:hypothetical protein